MLKRSQAYEYSKWKLKSNFKLNIEIIQVLSHLRIIDTTVMRDVEIKNNLFWDLNKKNQNCVRAWGWQYQ